MDTLLIFDLDDTIFETKSIDNRQVKPIFDGFESLLIAKYCEDQTRDIVTQLWKYPFDFVSNKYAFGDQLNSKFAHLINTHEYKFSIKPFQDFKSVQSLTHTKFLVTTGFLKLQNAKIHSLGIRDVFSEIYIDDILDSERIFKKGIFKKILHKKKSDSNLVYVIGDNPLSELKTGFELGLNTIQYAKYGQLKSKYANHFISNFKELEAIIEI